MSLSSMAKALGGKSYELDGRTDKFPKGGSLRDKIPKMFEGRPLDFGDSLRLELHCVNGHMKHLRLSKSPDGDQP